MYYSGGVWSVDKTQAETSRNFNYYLFVISKLTKNA